MQQLLLLCVTLGAGITFRHMSFNSQEAAKGVNAFLLYLALPACGLIYLPSIQWELYSFIPLGVALLNVFLSLGLAFLLKKYAKWTLQQAGIMAILGGLGNTSFWGFPALEILFGDTSFMPQAIIYDQGGSFILLSIFGLWAVHYFSNRIMSWKSSVKRLFMFPTLWVFIIVLLGFPWGISPANFKFIEKIALMISPLALFSMGLQWKSGVTELSLSKMGVILLTKLFFTPIFLLLLVYIFKIEKTPMVVVSILQSGMPPMITAAVLCLEFGLSTSAAVRIALFGMPISLLTLHFIHSLL